MIDAFDELPIEWQKLIRDLRKESAAYRIERNEARAELVALKAAAAT